MSNVTVQEALKMALEALTDVKIEHGIDYRTARDGIKAALADIEKCEPVWYHHKSAVNGEDAFMNFPFGLPDETPLFTSPQPREWVGLKISDDELLKYAISEELLLFASEDDFLAIANGVLELVNIKLNTKG